MKISEIKFEGRIYEFEPPVEVGDHKIDTLPQLAVIAAMGDEATRLPADVIDTQAEGFSELIDAYKEHPGGTLDGLNMLLMGKHTVTITGWKVG